MSCRKLAEVDSLSATRGISSSPETDPASRCILTPCPKEKLKPEAFHLLPSSSDRRRNTSFRRSWQSVILVADHANQRERTGFAGWLHLANYLALCPRPRASRGRRPKATKNGRAPPAFPWSGKAGDSGRCVPCEHTSNALFPAPRVTNAF